jgi:hypothetical protein
LEIISYLFSFAIVLFLYHLKIANLSFIQNLHVQTILSPIQDLAHCVDFPLQLAKHQRIQGLISNQVVDVDCIFLPNSVRPVLGLHEHGRSPVQLSEDDGGGSSESKTCAHGRDAEDGCANAELILETVHLFLPGFGRTVAVESDILAFEPFQMDL